MTIKDNQLGEMLREIRDPNTSPFRVDQIVRYFNELGVRGETFKSWIGADRRPNLNSPRITEPFWVSSPLHAHIMYMQANLTVPNATDKYIQYDQARNFGNIFEAYIEDSNGTRVRRGKDFSDYMPFRVDGFAIWAANAIGYRAAWIESFDANHNFLARSPLHTIKGFSEIDNVLPFSFTWFYEATTYEVKIKVHQTSGGNLTLKEFYAAFTLA